jgi:hypothetical protein
METKFTPKEEANTACQKKEACNPFILKKISKFQKLMQEPKKEDDELKQDNINPSVLLPYPTPLEFQIPKASFEVLIRSFPVELKNLINPVPALIEHSIVADIEKTEIKIQLPSNEEVEIVLERYDTDLTSFHVSFFGTEAVQKLIQENQEKLRQTLQKVMPNYGFAISPPFCKPISFSLPKTRRISYCRVKEGKGKK